MKHNKRINEYFNNNELDLEKIIEDFSAYVGTIIDNLSKRTIKDEDKEEIASDVFFILWKNRFKVDINKDLSPYVAGITKNVVKDYFKKNKTLLDISDFENILCGKNEVEDIDWEIEAVKKIEKVLSKMKDIDQNIFCDFYYSSKSIKDIAKERKISEFSVKQRLYRIRNKIKKEVK